MSDPKHKRGFCVDCGCDTSWAQHAEKIRPAQADIDSGRRPAVPPRCVGCSLRALGRLLYMDEDTP